MTLSSGLGSRLLIIKVTVRFGFNERKRSIRVFGLRSGSVRRPGFYPYIDAFICDRKWETKRRILGENFYLCTQQYQLYNVRMHILKLK